MTQEEKVKAYDEALEVMRQWIAPCHTKEQLDTLKKSVFPELSESEDERMKRIIMKFVWGYTNTPHSIINGDKSTLEYAKEVEAYLEKQKDIEDMWIEDRGQCFWNGVEEGKMLAEKQKEPHYTKRNALFDKCVENCDPEVMKRVSDEVDEMLEKEQKPAEWEDYKDKVNIPYCSSEPEWSEEDEKTINDACCWIAEYAGYLMDKNYAKASMLMCLTDKLKSLRPSWKPSEEQLEELNKVRTLNPGLDALYQQLKNM